jgi:uncharacterized membrane protein YfbV (UPF0208 family)
MSEITNLSEAIQMLNRVVWWAESSTDIKRIDFNLVAASERPRYEAAMQVVSKAIKNGEITRDEFMRRVGIE